jgi:hypothetical protein
MNKENRSEFASKLIEVLPHGSGIDCDWEYDVPETSNTVRLSNAYHCMNEHGYYDGYADFTLIVNPRTDENGLYDFKLQFNGRDSHRLNYKYGLREYLEDTLGSALNDICVYGKVISD